MEPGECITIKEIAQDQQVTYITALNYVKSGKIAGGRQFGREWRVPRANYEQFKRDGNAVDPTDLSVQIPMQHINGGKQ